MDNEFLKAKQLSLDIFEKMLLAKEWNSKEDFVNVVVSQKEKQAQQNAPKIIVRAYEELYIMLRGITFNEMKEIKTVLLKQKSGK